MDQLAILGYAEKEAFDVYNKARIAYRLSHNKENEKIADNAYDTFLEIRHHREAEAEKAGVKLKELPEPKKLAVDPKVYVITFSKYELHSRECKDLGEEIYGIYDTREEAISKLEDIYNSFEVREEDTFISKEFKNEGDEEYDDVLAWVRRKWVDGYNDEIRETIHRLKHYTVEGQ